MTQKHLCCSGKKIYTTYIEGSIEILRKSSIIAYYDFFLKKFCSYLGLFPGTELDEILVNQK